VRSELVWPVADASKKSWTESITSGMKKGFDSVAGVFKPSKTPTTPTDDPISLKTKAHASPQTRAAMAKLLEDANRYPEAVEQYRLALAETPKDIRVLLGYARLRARMGDLVEATKLFEQAASLSPADPAVLNNLGMCLAQRKMYKEAIGVLQQAVQLQPGNPLYRNNLAAILIEMGQHDAALAQLQAVNTEAVARYNLGYLLKKKGLNAEAARQFGLAWRLDPSLTQAQYWAAQLGGTPSGPAASQDPSLAANQRRPAPAGSEAVACSSAFPASSSNGSTIPPATASPMVRVGQNGQVERLPPLSPDSTLRR
jgi:tetratricopeptide (TPR) repeat protein